MKKRVNPLGMLLRALECMYCHLELVKLLYIYCPLIKDLEEKFWRSGEVPHLSTGTVAAAGYANKVRRVLFAITKGLDPKEVARAAAELNQRVWKIIQEKQIDKDEVIRVSCDFDVQDGKIVWNYDTLKVQRYLPEYEVQEFEQMKAELERLREQLKAGTVVPREALELVRTASERTASLRVAVEELEKALKRLGELLQGSVG